MGAFVSLLFFSSCASGFYILFDNSWALPLKVALIAHPAVSVAATAWLFIFTTKKARAQNMPQPWARLLAPPCIAGGALWFLLSAKGIHVEKNPAPLYCVFFLTLAASVAFLRYPSAAPEAPRGKFYFFTGGLAWSAWVMLAFTGGVIAVFFQGSNIVTAAALHRYCAYAMAALFGAHLYAVRPTLGPDARAATPVGLPPRAGIIATALTAAAAAYLFSLNPGPRWTIPLSSIPLENRAPAERSWPPTEKVSPEKFEQLDATSQCGNTPGCHAELVVEHGKSIHNITVRPEYFRANMRDLASDIGSHNRAICAGCHYPVGTMDARKDFDYYKGHYNFSCVFCHSVAGAGIDEKDKKKSWYEVRPQWGHLRMFPAAGKVSAEDRFFIRLNAAGHRRAFMPAVISTDDFCAACHHLQMPPLVTPGLRNPKCILCHMQPQALFGGPTNKKSHLFAGANPGPALLTGDKATADVIRRWAGGLIVPKLKGWETLWAVRNSDADPITSVPWVMISFYFDKRPEPGREFTVNVYSTNTGLGHSFPSGSLDLARAWLEFTAEDSRGRVFCSAGAVPPQGPVPGTDPPQLGGYMIGLDGKVVTHNRVWQVAKKTKVRAIENLLDIQDKIICRLPEDVGPEMKLSAKWNYRKLDQDFLDYGYGKGKVEVPPVVAGMTVKVVKVLANK